MMTSSEEGLLARGIEQYGANYGVIQRDFLPNHPPSVLRTLVHLMRRRAGWVTSPVCEAFGRMNDPLNSSELEWLGRVVQLVGGWKNVRIATLTRPGVGLGWRSSRYLRLLLTMSKERHLHDGGRGTGWPGTGSRPSIFTGVTQPS